MRETYQPDSWFVERLEWQLASEYRRTDRFKSAAEKISVPRAVAATILVLGVLLTGVATIKAADYIKESWRKKLEIARAETEVTLKQAQLESFREAASRAEARFSNGLLREEEYQVLKIAADKAELTLQRALLNLDEVNITGEIPRDELYAPVMGGRDFVSERLQLNLKETELDLSLLSRRLGRIALLVENHLASEDRLDQIQRDISARMQLIDRIQKELDLRIRYLSGEITARQVEVHARLSAAEYNLRNAESKVESLQTGLNRLKSLSAQGMISPMEVDQMQFALDAAQAELKLATLEIDVLEKHK